MLSSADYAAMEAEVDAAKARMLKIQAEAEIAYWKASPDEQMRARLEFWKRLVPPGEIKGVFSHARVAGK